MLSVSAIKPLNRTPIIWPGPVASVGDCALGQTLRSSLPGDFRAGPNYGAQGSRVGSSAQDGGQVGYSSHGGPAGVVDDTWTGKRDFKTVVGWYQQDVRAPDKFMDSMVGALPQYSWNNQVARANTKFGDLYPPSPNGLIIPPVGGMRGGMYPRVTGVESGEPPIEGLQNPVYPSTTPEYGRDIRTIGRRTVVPRRRERI